MARGMCMASVAMIAWADVPTFDLKAWASSKVVDGVSNSRMSCEETPSPIAALRTIEA